MDSPKRIVNMTMGIQGSMGEVLPIAKKLPSQPHWNTATITP